MNIPIAMIALAAATITAPPDTNLTAVQDVSHTITTDGSRAARACDLGTATADLDAGNVRARMYNHGGLFWIGGSPIYEVPKGSGSNAIFASGIWVGGMEDGELRMAGATYSGWEFWPGPLDLQGQPPGDCSFYDRIFLVDRSDLVRLDETGEATADIVDWPWQLGAPVLDGDGDPDNYDIAGGDRPDILGDQMAWWVMNDAGNVHLTTETPPIGLEVQVSAFVFARDDAVGNSTFYRYRFVYKGSLPLSDVNVGFWSDPDLGDARDDYVGSDSLLGLGYVYNGNDFDGGSTGYGSEPPAVGYDILKGPLADTDGLDNDHDGDVDEAGESLSMTSFVYFNNDQSDQGNPTQATEYDNYLRALWRSGKEITVGGTGYGDYSSVPTRFMFTGDPPEFWSEEQPTPGGTPNVPGDRRFVMATGPFEMQPGESVDVWLAINWSRGTDRLHSVSLLKENSAAIQQLFDEGLNPAPQPPPDTAPALTAPADNALQQPVNPTLKWEKVSGTSTYEIQIDDNSDFSSPIISDIVSSTTLSVETPFPSDTQLHWRVRASNSGGVGPWSPSWTFSTGATLLTEGQSGLVVFDESIMFVEVAGPDDSYACGPNATSTFGCAQVGGNLVYASFNGSGEYVMYREGPGPEEVITDFAPNDFEIRFSESGSYAYHLFDSQKAIWVPFEVWDIGPTYTGTAVNPNDPANDVRMIPVLFAGGRDECNYNYFDDATLSPFGVWPGTTQRVYAYYPTTTYREFEDHVKPLVDADASGCPVVGDLTENGSPALLNTGRGRPLQRIIFEGEPASDPPHPAFGVVIRFYTQDPIAPSAPIVSAPLDGAAELSVPITLAWNSASEQHEIQVAASPAFQDTVIAATTGAAFYRIESLPSPGTYYWRVKAAKDGVTSDWSAVSSFSASVVVGTEDDSALPDHFTLDQNYPNPFNPTTTIRFGLPTPEHVTIGVYDVIGRLVSRLVDAALPAGHHRIIWNAEQQASGMYVYRITAGGYQESRPMLLVR